MHEKGLGLPTRPPYSSTAHSKSPVACTSPRPFENSSSCSIFRFGSQDYSSKGCAGIDSNCFVTLLVEFESVMMRQSDVRDGGPH